MKSNLPCYRILLSILLSLLGIAGSGHTGELTFPKIEAEDLNGKAIKLPEDLPGNPTVILVPFVRKQQDDIDLWIKALDLKKEGSTIKWLEVPYVGAKARPFKVVIDRGMKSGITSTEDRARTITVYEEHKLLLDALNLKTTDQVFVIVAETSGKVRVLVAGTPDSEKTKKILSALMEDRVTAAKGSSQ